MKLIILYTLSTVSLLLELDLLLCILTGLIAVETNLFYAVRSRALLIGLL